MRGADGERMSGEEAADASATVVAVLKLAWIHQPAAVYQMGCVRPGDHAFSWRIMYTSMRWQIISLCRDTRDFRQLWAPDPVGCLRPRMRLSDTNGLLLELHSGRPWNDINTVSCPGCGSEWPVRRWTWAREGASHCKNLAHRRTFSFCALHCPRMMFCPCVSDLRTYLRVAEAPRWVVEVYRRD